MSKLKKNLNTLEVHLEIKLIIFGLEYKKCIEYQKALFEKIKY